MIFLLAPVIACVAYLVLTCLYNLFLHPLRNVPGPFAARLSDLWKLHSNLQGRKAHRIHAAHKRYGPIVRVAPNELSFANPAAVRDIYNSDHFVKEERFYFAKRIFHEDHLMSTRDTEAHKQRKKLLQRGFSQASMLEFEPRMTDKIKTLFDKWASLCRSEPNAAIEVYPWVYWLSFDTVYHLMFDQDAGSVREGKAHGVVRYMRAWRPTFIYKEFVPQLERWGPYVPGYIGGYFRDVQTWKQFAVSLIRDCRAHGVKTPFLQAALEGTDQALGRPLTDSELAEEAMGGMFGGSGTTANTFIYLLWAIRSRPDIVEKLHDELKATFPGDLAQVPSAADCAKLPYLQAVINETLRRDPTIIATLPRSAVCDTNVAGFVIPKGVRTSCAILLPSNVLRDADW